MQKVIVIGAGFGGLSAAAKLAKSGFDVTVIEKNHEAGGRAITYKEKGFTFDMGPSWYMMPDVFEKYFAELGEKVEDYIDLRRLDPSYRVYFSKDKYFDIAADLNKNIALFESLEPGAGEKLNQYLKDAEYKYRVGMKGYVYKTYKTIFDLFDRKMIFEGLKLDVFSKLDKHVRKYFKNEYLIKILEFMVVFIGGSPKNVPALYSMLAHTDMNLGIWYPMGGFNSVAKAFEKLGKKYGVKYIYDANVTWIDVSDDGTKKVITDKGEFKADIVIVNADYQFVENHLLAKKYQTYSEKYWDRRTIAPSCLMFYLGINKKLKNLRHHTLFLDKDWDAHFDTIFKNKKWPEAPLSYVCAPSITDNSVAPEGMENIVALIPIAPGIEDSVDQRQKYFNMLIDNIEKEIGEKFRDNIIVNKSFCIEDFQKTFNAYKGNAFGLAHTLFQTAVFRPSHKSKKIKGLYYVGHFTVPGVGVPITVISGQVVSQEIINEE